ncbi:hypothetical protein C1H46_027497 [Malus baccata]|uniref:RBR-type E3 ubiquitin transferase n=1 Tax=Malus baccata TaxID=106549 RepID=A0A540LKI3_MALBA|nr:hypothetical protein C1H46_027497 [Malus baccata]
MREYQLILLQPKLRYTVLKEADIREHQLQCMTEVCSKLHVSRSSAIILLRHCNWNVSMLFDKWFEEEDDVRNKLGLFRKVPLVDRSAGSFTCEICFETCDAGGNHSISSNLCGHFYCIACWAACVSELISNDGVGCLSLKCPHPGCGAAVGEDLILFVLVTKVNGDADKAKYLQYLLRSYVEDSKGKRKWCPSPGCDYAVDFVGGYGTCDVSCLRSYRFCSNCHEEGHSPVNCDTVAKWMMLKNENDSECVDWILANTKPCPKCKRNIKKANQGCNHMTCSAPCGFEFCWTFLEWWNWHGLNCSGNGFLEGVESEHSRRKKEMTNISLKEMSKVSSNRFVRYYVLWVYNRVYKKIVVEDFHRLVQDVHLKKFSVKYIKTNPVLDFVVEAWQEIIECRWVLQWIYVYGYFIPKHERVKRQLFKYLLGEAENGLEKLCHCAEVELELSMMIDLLKSSSNFEES